MQGTRATQPTHASATDTSVAEEEIRVWDPLVRLFHWSLVAGIAIAWLTADELEKVHEWTGYFVAALVGIRIVWGFVGTRHARFSQFVKGPREVLGYMGRIARGRAERHIGHNPAGGAMIIALLAAIIVVSATGWMMTLDAFWGVDWVEEAHEISANLILLLVALHVAGVIHASISHGENLVRAMITGRKRARLPDEHREA